MIEGTHLQRYPSPASSVKKMSMNTYGLYVRIRMILGGDGRLEALVMCYRPLVDTPEGGVRPKLIISEKKHACPCAKLRLLTLLSFSSREGTVLHLLVAQHSGANVVIC